MNKNNLHIFFWDEGEREITIVAETEEEALELLYKKDNIAWSIVQNLWDEFDWSNDKIRKLNEEFNKSRLKKNLVELQRIMLEREGFGVLNPNRIKPKIDELKPLVVINSYDY